MTPSSRLVSVSRAAAAQLGAHRKHAMEPHGLLGWASVKLSGPPGDTGRDGFFHIKNDHNILGSSRPDVPTVEMAGHELHASELACLPQAVSG